MCGSRFGHKAAKPSSFSWGKAFLKEPAVFASLRPTAVSHAQAIVIIFYGVHVF